MFGGLVPIREPKVEAGRCQRFEIESLFVSRPNIGQPNGFQTPDLGHRSATH